MKYVYNTSGTYVAFIIGDYIFYPDCEWLGIIKPNNQVYDNSGAYLGFLLDDDRIVRQRDVNMSRIVRPMRPSRPPRPPRPSRRPRMTRLPSNLIDVFENGRAITQISTSSNSKLQSLLEAEIYSDDGVFLGKITRNKFDAASILNQFGLNGSKFSSTSIFNPYGRYGGKYSPLSPFNQYSTTPPKIVRNSTIIGYLTKNKFLSTGSVIDPDDLVSWLSG